MSNITIPFNITLLDASEDTFKGVLPVTSLDIFDGLTKNFHNEGLYSTIIFGRVGDERRKRRFSYIDIKIPILHPMIYRSLCALKKMYGEIMASKAYATWDPNIKDFVKASALDGSTGFHFFMQHWREIEFDKRPSDLREELIALVQKFKDKPSTATPTKIIVSPAGYRDFQIQGDGRYSEEEVNTLYKKLLSFSATIPSKIDEESMSSYDSKRMALQRTFNDIYNLYESMVKGKKKLMMGKWASRKIYNGTRNVVTSMSVSADELHSPGNLGFNDTVIGVYQYLKATLPVSKYNLRNGFLSKVFVGINSPAVLVNKKTLKPELVDIRPEIYDGWMSEEGVERLINLYGEESLRHQQLEINGRWLGLIYKGPGVFKIFQDIDELPEHLNKDDVHPLTFAELVYASIYRTSSKYPIFVTRYPIASPGSIYPSRTYIKTTIKAEERIELNEDWGTDGASTAYQFPISGLPFVESLSPHASRLAGLNMDFDGDTASGQIPYSDESIAEIGNLFNSRRYYVSTSGELNYSVKTDTVEFVLHNMCKEPTSISTEGYREGDESTFTHHGVEYSIDKIHEQLEKDKTLANNIKVSDLKWILEYGHADKDRVENSDTSTPILYTKENGKYYTIDGFHRLTKAVDKNIHELQGYLVTKQQLDKAKV